MNLFIVNLYFDNLALTSYLSEWSHHITHILAGLSLQIPGIFYLVETLKIQMVPQNVFKHMSADATVQGIVPIFVCLKPSKFHLNSDLFAIADNQGNKH